MYPTYDLHTHTLCSDGTLSPEDLIARAQAKGVQVLALTDHDVTEGVTSAQAAGRRLGVQVLPGVEVSVTWQRQTVHIVGLCIDSQNQVLQHGLARLREFRGWRAQEIDRRLQKKNVVGAYEFVRQNARGAILSRTHFARFLVAEGYVRDMGQAFKQYLGPGRAAHVPGQWAALDEAVGWIRAAGGIAVVAHPARCGLTTAKLRRLLREFKDCGGQSIEVLSGSCPAADSAQMARLAVEHGLLGSCGSDYHGPEQTWVDLGRLPALPPEVTPVWSIFPDQYTAPQRASGI